jgi:hypothetical protein
MHILELVLRSQPVVRVPDDYPPINIDQRKSIDSQLILVAFDLEIIYWVPETGDGWTICKGPPCEREVVPDVRLFSCYGSCSNELFMPPSTLVCA